MRSARSEPATTDDRRSRAPTTPGRLNATAKLTVSPRRTGVPEVRTTSSIRICGTTETRYPGTEEGSCESWVTGPVGRKLANVSWSAALANVNESVTLALFTRASGTVTG